MWNQVIEDVKYEGKSTDTDVMIAYCDGSSTVISNVRDYGVLQNMNMFYCCNEDGCTSFFPNR